MSSGATDTEFTSQKRSLSFRLAVLVAVVLSLASWTLMLIIPTASINVDTIYEGF